MDASVARQVHRLYPHGRLQLVKRSKELSKSHLRPPRGLFLAYFIYP